MKKLIFLLSFAFIGQQAFSQMYIITITWAINGHPSGCYVMGSSNMIMTTIDPSGTETYTCLNKYLDSAPSSLSTKSRN